MLPIKDKFVYRCAGPLSVRWVDVVSGRLSGECAAPPPLWMLYAPSYPATGTLQNYSRVNFSKVLHPVESLHVTRIGSRCRAWGGEDVLESAYSEAHTGRTRWMGPLWGCLPPLERRTAGALAAHRVRQKQKATRTHLRYKAWSRRNHETGSVGGKHTHRTANSSQPILHSPLLIPVWNSINSSGKKS